MQKVQTTLLPFHLHRKTVEVPYGLTIQQMVEHAMKPRRRAPRRDAQFNYEMKMFGNRRERRSNWLRVIVTVDGVQINKDKWAVYRPEPKSIIGVNVVAGKSGKNPLGTILSLALMVAAPYLAGAAAFSMAGGVIGGGIYTAVTAGQAVLYGALRIGIGIVGFLASSMLSSTPKQHVFKNVEESPTMFIEGASNDILKYGVIPVPLGTNRMFPPQAALPYTETVGNKQYARQLFTYGYGDELVLANRRIGETNLDQFQGVNYADKLNGDLHEGIEYYSIEEDIFQEGQSVVLSSEIGYTVVTTQIGTSQASVDLTFVNGLTKYLASGRRVLTTVEFEIQYAPVGTPEISDDWTTGYLGKTFGATSKVAPNPPRGMTRYNIVTLNKETAAVKIIPYTSTDTPPAVPDGEIRIASFTTTTAAIDPYEAEITNFIDERAPYIPDIIADTDSFIPSFTDMTVDVSDGSFVSEKFTVSAATAEGLRISKEITFPSAGQWDIRIKRVTDDTDDDKIRDVATLTSVRSIAYRSPVNQEDINGTGMKILATDQLNGTVNRYNVDVTNIILDYFASVDEWLTGPTSNPASMYRHVLQSQAFVKRLTDDKINLTKLEEWHVYCESKGLTYNRVIDYQASIDDVLNDICAAGMATPHKVDGIYGVIIDNERPEIKGMVNPRNSWGYSGNINYPDLPHALRVEFRNKEKGYNLDEVIVYADGYSSVNATLYERLSFPSCTNYELAVFYGRMYMANALLQPETHKWNMDFENLTFNRGDRITFVNDTILVGAGSGRIKSVIQKPGDTTKLIGFVLDETISIPSASQFAVRIRHADASAFTYYLLDTVVGETNTFTFASEVDFDDEIDPETEVETGMAKWLTSLCNFVEDGEELDLIITDIKGNADQSAVVTALNYAPERFDVVNQTIPPFDSHITIPLDLQAPLPPQVGGAVQSDETVMTKNPDGSYVGRMIIPLINPNEPSVIPVARIRHSGATVWGVPDILFSSAQQIVITGLEDGSLYDIEVRYQRQGGRQLVSIPLQYNGVTYVGASSMPDDVENFKCVISGENILFSWDKNPEIDIAYYTLRYSSLFSGATYATAQEVAEKVYENRLTLPYQGGTYFIKAVDILGNESAGATAVITFDANSIGNVVATLTEQPAFSGTHDNTIVSGGNLVIDDISLGIGTYYFANNVSLDDVFDCILSASVSANGVYRNDIFAIDDVFAVDDLFGSGDNDVFEMDDIFAVDDLFGIGADSWRVTLQYRVSQDNGGIWSDWTDFVAGHVSGSDFEFRIILESFAPNVSPSVNTILEVKVDMPDRIERGEDIACPASTGAVIVYPAAFRNNPAVAITIQDGDANDELVYLDKDETGFTVKIWNTTTAGYVDRILDYITSGYGRVQS